MKKEVMRIKLIVAHAKCLKCGFERTLYFTSDNMYGERVVSTKSGNYCAYANLQNENIIQELEKYCIEYFSEKKINISKNKLARIISNIYGITCDDIFEEKIDTTSNTKCINCCEGIMVENKEYGERLMEVEVPKVTHYFWGNLDKDAKKDQIEKELIRQGWVPDL